MWKKGVEDSIKIVKDKIRTISVINQWVKPNPIALAILEEVLNGLQAMLQRGSYSSYDTKLD